MKEFSRRSLLKAGAGQKCGHVGKNVGIALSVPNGNFILCKQLLARLFNIFMLCLSRPGVY